MQQNGSGRPWKQRLQLHFPSTLPDQSTNKLAVHRLIYSSQHIYEEETLTLISEDTKTQNSCKISSRSQSQWKLMARFDVQPTEPRAVALTSVFDAPIFQLALTLDRWPLNVPGRIPLSSMPSLVWNSQRSISFWQSFSVNQNIYRCNCLIRCICRASFEGQMLYVKVLYGRYSVCSFSQ